MHFVISRNNNQKTKTKGGFSTIFLLVQDKKKNIAIKFVWDGEKKGGEGKKGCGMYIKTHTKHKKRTHIRWEENQTEVIENWERKARGEEEEDEEEEAGQRETDFTAESSLSSLLCLGERGKRRKKLVVKVDDEDLSFPKKKTYAF